MTTTTGSLSGIGVSEGAAFGRAVPVRPAPGIDHAEPASSDAEADAARVASALSQVAATLQVRAERVGGDAKDILLMTAKMATDRGLAKAINKQLASGSGITRSVSEAVDGYVEKLQQLGGYMAQRSTDLYDVRDRAISVLRGLPQPGVPEMSEPGIIVARDLAPAETAILDPKLVLGIVTAEGGPTSHTAIIASGMGIPAVVRATGADQVAEGTALALDGGSGKVIIEPTDEQVQQLQTRAATRREALASVSGPGQTSDGFSIPLLANVGSAADAVAAAAKDVEGVGLFRTEFMFLDRQEPPTLAEQTDSYTKALQAFGQRRVVIRTLDAGADKPLAFADLGAEENPALGRRGLRLSQAREDLLETQLQALAAARQATGADLRVMAPMVATVDEARWFAAKAREHGLATVGIMVETPAAAIQSRFVLDGLQFASIGTNDLTQYTMAADRLQGALADLLTPWQPAVLHMIKATCDGGAATGAKIGVCGEAAGDPLLALILVGMGVSSLSMSPSKVPAVRAVLRHHSMAQCQEFAQLVLAAPTSQAAREAVLAKTDEFTKAIVAH